MSTSVNRNTIHLVSIEGISGVLIVKAGHVGLAGKLPPLVKMGRSTSLFVGLGSSKTEEFAPPILGVDFSC